MTWSPCKVAGWTSPTAQQSDTGYLLCRSPQDGFVRDGRVCYTLSKHGNIVETRWADDTEEDRLRVVRELKGVANDGTSE